MGAAGSPTCAQPSGRPTVWTQIDSDPAENGCDTHRNVRASFYACDGSYFYLRLENQTAAGWPSTSPSGDARYIWFIDTPVGNVTRSGGTVSGAEYMLMVEDLGDNLNDPNTPRDRLGEITLLDDLANAGFSTRWDSTNPPRYTTNTPVGAPSPSGAWRRLTGTGRPAPADRRAPW